MNTKGIKFLAVLAVMVMAFAAIVVLAPADKDAEAVIVYGNDDVVVDPTVIDETVKASEFYISDDATVKIKDIKASALTFYVQNGAELELDFKKAAASSANVGKPITIYTVTADQQRPTTSTVDLGVAGGQDGTVDGKIKIVSTEFKFTGADKQNVVYKAMMPKTVKTVTTSGGYKTDVTTGFGNFAYISATEELLSASAKAKVAVAPGQSIESKSNMTATLDYGVAFRDGNLYTYYATGMNAGTVTIDATTDSVTIKNGSVITSNGSASIKATSAVYDSVNNDKIVLTYSAANQIDVAGTITDGTMTVSGKVLFQTGFKNKATITLNANAEVVANSVMVVDGVLILKNECSKSEKLSISGAGKIVAENEKLWDYGSGTKPALKFLNMGAFKGQYDVTAISKNADVEDAFSTATIEKNQVFRMVGDTIVAEAFTVEGTLIIEPGVTLTITKTNDIGASVTVYGQYAQIINYGTIAIKTTHPASTNPKVVGLQVLGGTVLNYGTISASSSSDAAGNDTFLVNYTATLPSGITEGGFGFVNAGTISVGKHDTISLDSKFTNEGSVSINGTFKGNGLKNGGLFTLNNAKISDNLAVTMQKGSEFVISAVEVAQGKTITVQNAPNTAGTEYSNYISVKAPGTSTAADADKVRISGLTVTDTSTSTNNKLNMSGSISVNIPSTVTGKALITTKGNIDVTATATINKGYELDFTNATTLNVTGALTFAKEVTLKTGTNASKLLMYVTGIVTDVDDILTNVKYISAMYRTLAPVTIYTTLEEAVPAAALADVTQVYVGSADLNVAGKEKYVTLTESLTIPAGLTVDGAFIVIDEAATVYVENGGRFSFNTTVIESGMIAAEDVNDIDFDAVVADVKEEDDESTAAVCMSLEVAIALASPGDIIKLANPFYAADSELTIPEGIVVDATAKSGTDFVLVNSDLIVNGTLIVDQFAFIATTDDTIGITVNGFIYDKCSDGRCFVDWWYTPFGVSYYWTDEEDQTWYVLTTIENIQPAINIADDAKVSVEGDAELDELNISGRDDMPAEVLFKGNVEVGVINIDDATLKFTNGKKISTTVKDALGSITIIGAYAKDNLSIFSLEDSGVYMAGAVTDSPTGTYLIMFDGKTGMDGTTKSAIEWGNYVAYDEETESNVLVSAPSVLFAGETTVIGKKAKVNSNDEKVSGMATITGLVYVDHGSKLTLNCDVEITGGLVAAERTEEAVPGAIVVNGNIFVGMLANEIYDMDYYVPDYRPVLAGTAILSGKVSLAEKCFIYAAPDALIDPEIIEDLDGLTVYVDGEEWFLLYAYESKTFEMDGLRVPMFNAKISGIKDGNDSKINYSLMPNTTDVINQTSGVNTLSGYGNAIYIGLNYEIFTVKIKTDGSVKAVYIDGILMETGQSENIFLMRNVAAGTHKVTVEPSAGYTADGCILYTEMETILPGMAFTFTQYDCTEVIGGEDTVVYNIKGTQVEPEPVPPTPEEESQWTITTILLVILVVLIAIMAVIVALRLNRS